MAKLTISAISTLSATPTRPPKFDVEPNPNMMPTSQEKAPVLLTIQSEETVNAEKFAELFAGECDHFDVVEAARRISAVGEVIGRCAAECQNVQLGFANLEVNVTGTIPDTNAPLNDANKAEYIAVESAAVRRQFAQIETRIPTSVTPADVKRVRDVATGDNKIHGTSEFYIQGLKLTQSGEGEKVELFTADMSEKVVDVTVIDATSEISLKAMLADAVPAGRYYLLVTTLAGGETTLYPVGISVTIADDGDKSPALTSFVQLNQAGVVEAVGKMLTIYDMIEVKGKNLPEGIKGRYALYDKDSGELKTATEWEANPSHTMFERVSSTTVRAQFKVNATPYPDGMWLDEGHPIKFEVKLPDESIISIALPLV